MRDRDRREADRGRGEARKARGRAAGAASRPSRARLAAAFACAVAFASAACSFWDPSRPFEREAPEVNRAIALLDAGDAAAAATTLEEYLSTGACDQGSIGAPEIVRRKANGGLDLGLSLFAIAESFGRRFGDEETDAASPPQVTQARAAQVGCALRIALAVAGDDAVPLDLRAHARYLEGNLHFLLGEYEDAVRAYDKALTLTPALVDAGDAIARDAAWNRAIALRRIEDKKDAGQDGGDDGGGDGAPPDGGNDSGSNDAGNDAGKDGGGDSGPKDASPDGSNEAGAPPPPPPESQPDAGAPPPPKASQDDRILEQLEHAPTVQQEAAKKAAASRRVRGMADK